MRAPCWLFLGLFQVACGGTSSETPWPVEPDERLPQSSIEAAPPPAVPEPEPPAGDAGTEKPKRYVGETEPRP